jgi:DNA-binding NarL/FixJ family response regulator
VVSVALNARRAFMYNELELEGCVNDTEASRADLLGALTERERQVVHLVGQGLSNKAIARRLDICEGTIKLHLHHIYQKLAIGNRTALAVCWVRAAPVALPVPPCP